MADINQIIKLSNHLRDEGMAVSIRTSQTAYDTCELLSNMNRNTLKEALRAVYVKNKYDIPKFNKAFDKIFQSNYKKDLEKKSSSKRIPQNNFKHSNKMRIIKRKTLKHLLIKNLKTNVKWKNIWVLLLFMIQKI